MTYSDSLGFARSNLDLALTEPRPGSRTSASQSGGPTGPRERGWRSRTSAWRDGGWQGPGPKIMAWRFMMVFSFFAQHDMGGGTTAVHVNKYPRSHSMTSDMGIFYQPKLGLPMTRMARMNSSQMSPDHGLQMGTGTCRNPLLYWHRRETSE